MLADSLGAALLGDRSVLDDDAAFFLVDDDWGGHHQKLCIIGKTFWKACVEEAIREVLAKDFPQWGVVVVFDAELARTHTSRVVYADATTERMRYV